MLSLGSILVPRHFSAELPARWKSTLMKLHKSRGAFYARARVGKCWVSLKIHVSC